jgi:hypothetical protein
MVDRNELMERFGDTDFLHQLWQKAKQELPPRLSYLTPLLTTPPIKVDQEDLAKRLHKLRGLISNFMTEKDSIPKLVLCEEMVEVGNFEGLPSAWMSFEKALEAEVDNLESWFQSEGFS